MPLRRTATRILLGVLVAGLMTGGASHSQNIEAQGIQAKDILGVAPSYASRKPGTIPDPPLPNADADAATRLIWAPRLDEGYVPQGVALIGGAAYLSAYRSVEASQSRGHCRLFLIDALSGRVTGSLDLPPACGHARGVAAVSATI